MSEPYRGIVINGKLLSPDAKFVVWKLPKLSEHPKQPLMVPRTAETVRSIKNVRETR